MLKAFDTYRELFIRDVRLSYNDLITLIHNMISQYSWDHYVYYFIFPFPVDIAKCWIFFTSIIQVVLLMMLS